MSRTGDRVPTAILYRLNRSHHRLDEQVEHATHGLPIDASQLHEAGEDIEDVLAWARGELDASDFEVEGVGV